MMKVETKNCSLDTMSVTINALHVNGKQMTLAVFRQLPLGMESEDSALWGVVRYTIKDEELWLVFSGDGTLFRRPLYPGRRYISDYGTDRLLGEIKKHERAYHQTEFKREQLLKLRNQLSVEQAAFAKAKADEDKRQARDTALANLPQLFIAV